MGIHEEKRSEDVRCLGRTRRARPSGRGDDPPRHRANKLKRGVWGRGSWIVIVPSIFILAAGVVFSPAPGWPFEGGPALPDPPASAALIHNLEQETREAKDLPDAVIAALRLAPGQVIGDIGAGTGYFARRLARRVGPAGQVFAVDIDSSLLEELNRRAASEGITNIVPILARPDDPLLEEASCDLLFLHHVYVHLPDRVAYLKHLKTRLKRGGRVAIVGWRKSMAAPKGAQAGQLEKAVTAEQVVNELDVAGFSIVEDILIRPQKYFLIASPRE